MKLPLAAAAAAVVVLGAGASAARDQTSVRTLLVTRAPIASFALDGRELAWVTREREDPCRRKLHFRSVRGGASSALRIGCRLSGDLALAGRTALWKTFLGGGNTELDLAVNSARVGDRRAHTVESLLEWIDLDSGLPNPDPPLAGAGSLLAYYAEYLPARKQAVRRVVRGRARTMFAFPRPLALAVDGRRVAVVRQKLSGDGCGCASSAGWSPDGRKVAFLEGDVNIASVEPAEVAVINADGTGRDRITHDGLTRLDSAGQLAGVDWSPDGSAIAYTYWKSAASSWTIAVVRPDGTGAHDLASGIGPRWSPDGSAIAFTHFQPTTENSGVTVMKADGSSARQVTSSGAGPSWSPDGTRLVYTDGGALFIVNSDGSGLHRLVSGGPTARDPDWSPDGSRIAFAAQGGFTTKAGIWVVNADGTNLRQLTAERDGEPRWSPDGGRILFTSARDDILHVPQLRLELFTMAADGSDVRPLTFSRAAEWASVGELHALSGRRLASFTATGAPARLGRRGMVTESRGVALAGNRVAVLSTLARTGAAQISLFNAATGALQHVVAVPAAASLELGGVHGRWVVFRIGRTIRLLDAVTLRSSTLTVRHADPIGLSVSGNRLAWAENAGLHGRILTLTLPR